MKTPLDAKSLRNTLTALALLLPLFPAQPNTAAAMEFRSGDQIDLRGQYSDNVFASGGRINATLRSTDDLFLAGGDITFKGSSTGDLYMAGGNLTLRGAELADGVLAGGMLSISQARFSELIAVGGDIRLEQVRIQDDLILAGGSVRLDEGTEIEGSMVLTAGEAQFSGSAGRESRFSGEEITLNGRFQGDVRVDAAELNIGPATVIAGNLVYSAEDVDISPEARIQGQVTKLPPPEFMPQWQRYAGPFWTVSGILFALGLLLIPGLVVLCFPGVSDQGREKIRSHFWEALGKGTLAALLIPIVWVLLIMSLIGIPVALALLPVLGVLWIFSKSLAAYVIGDQIRLWIQKPAEMPTPPPASRKARLGWTLLGALILILVLWIPIVGILAILVAFLAGLGATVMLVKAGIRKSPGS